MPVNATLPVTLPESVPVTLNVIPLARPTRVFAAGPPASVSNDSNDTFPAVLSTAPAWLPDSANVLAEEYPLRVSDPLPPTIRSMPLTAPATPAFTPVAVLAARLTETFEP